MKQIRLAFVDDEIPIINMFKAAFIKSPAIKFLGSATRGGMFIERFKNTPLDVIVLDIGLPDMEGTDLAREFLKQRLVKENPPKIIFFTKYNNFARANTAFELKASMIGKEVMPDDLIEYIKLVNNGAMIILENPIPLFRKESNYGVKLAIQKLLSEEQLMIACSIRNGLTADDIARNLGYEKTDRIKNQIKEIRKEFKKIVNSENINIAIIAAVMERSGLCSDLDLHDLSRVLLS